MKYKSEVLVIGGGVVGVCSSHYLGESGKNVTLIEKGEIGSGSSYGNAGLIVPSHSTPLPAPGVLAKGMRWMFNPDSPFYIKPRLDLDLFKWLWKFRDACNEDRMRKSMPVIRDLSLASLKLYDEFGAIGNLEFGFEKQGLLMVYKSEKGLKDGLEEAYLMAEIGLEVQILDAAEIAQLEPNFRIDAIGGVFYSQDAHLIPTKFVRELAGHVEKKGVEIHTSTEVLGFETSGRKVTAVKTTRGDFTADEIVLSSGSWSSDVARDLGIKLPIQPAKGYSITHKRPEKSPSIPINLSEAKVGVTPMGDTLRFAGTLELAGLDLSINRRRVNAIQNAVPDYFPDIDVEKLELIEIWRGLRPCTPDGLPFLGRSPKYENLTVAAGHAMIGMSLGPISGKLVSQLVTGEQTSLDLTALKVDRFD